MSAALDTMGGTVYVIINQINFTQASMFSTFWKKNSKIAFFSTNLQSGTFRPQFYVFKIMDSDNQHLVSTSYCIQHSELHVN